MRCVLACSRCRQQKIRCIHNGSPPCAYCLHKGCVDECTLTFPPRKLKNNINKKKKKSRQESFTMEFRENEEMQMSQRLQGIQTNENNKNLNISVDVNQASNGRNWGRSNGRSTMESTVPAPPMDAIFSSGIIPNIDDEMIRFQSMKNNAHNSMFSSIENLVHSTPKNRIIAAAKRISVCFPEFLFLHPTVLVSRMEQLNPILIGSLLATCSFFCPFEDPNSQSESFISDQWLGANSFMVKDCFYEKLSIEAIFNGHLLLDKPDLEICQSLLFLSCVRWGHNEYYSSWMLHGCAARMIQALQFDESFQQKCKQQPLLNELNIRTFWSAFCLDRIISTGENRCFVITKFQDMILPLSDDQFLALSYTNVTPHTDTPLDSDHLFNHSNKTSWNRSQANDSDSGNNKQTNSGFNSEKFNKILTVRNFHLLSTNMGKYTNRELCYYIQSYCLWSKINEYMMEGGRQIRPTEVPWDIQNSVVGKLINSLETYWVTYPSEYKWDNIDFKSLYQKDRKKAHLLLQLNCLFYLTKIFCIREYLPFLPDKIDGPCGPTEPPYLPEPPYPSYWVDTAKNFFTLIRKLGSILEEVYTMEKTPTDSNVHLIANSPFCAFCAFVCAIQSSYGAIFPFMNPESALHANEKKTSLAHISRVMIKILKSRENTCPVTKNWLHMVYKVQELYKHVAANRLNKLSSSTGMNGRQSTDKPTFINKKENQTKKQTPPGKNVKVPTNASKLSTVENQQTPTTISINEHLNQIPFNDSFLTSTAPDPTVLSKGPSNNVFSQESKTEQDNFLEFEQFNSQCHASSHSAGSSSTSNTPHHIADVKPETDKLSLLFSDHEFEMLMNF